MDSAATIIAITVGSVVAVLVLTIVLLKRSGALGMSKAKQQQALRLMQTGAKARAMVVSIQPTGMVVNMINIQCDVRFRLEPLRGAPAFEATKRVFLAQTAMPRIGDVWPSWYDPADPSQFAVGQPTEISTEQMAIYHEFGIRHPFDPQPAPGASPLPPPPPG